MQSNTTSTDFARLLIQEVIDDSDVIPHLHAHILPRYFTDDAPNRPIDPGLKGREMYLSPQGYEERIKLIRSHIGVES